MAKPVVSPFRLFICHPLCLSRICQLSYRFVGHLPGIRLHTTIKNRRSLEGINPSGVYTFLPLSLSMVMPIRRETTTAT